jgi:hypothetical protein
MAKAMTGNQSALASVLQCVAGLDNASMAFLLEQAAAILEDQGEHKPFDLNRLAGAAKGEDSRFGWDVVVLADICGTEADGTVRLVVAPGQFGQGPALLIPRQTNVLAWLEALASAMEAADQAEAMLIQLDTSSHVLSTLKDAVELLAEALDQAVATRNGVALNAVLRHSDMLIGWVRLRNGDGTPRRPKADDWGDEEWKRLGEYLVVIQACQAGWDLDPLRLLVADWLSARDSDVQRPVAVCRGTPSSTQARRAS